MKKLILIPLLIFALISVQAKSLSGYDYVITKNGTFFCQQVTVGLLKTKCILQNGESMNIRLSEILAYKTSGRIYERMPVYLDDHSTGSQAFMELISMRDGLKLFKYCAIDYTDIRCSAYNQYYIFRNGEYVLQLNSKSGGHLLNFFNVAIT